MRAAFPALCVLVALTLGACKLPSINLATNDPIRVDIAMRLDVYQYGDGEKPPAAGTPAAASAPPAADAATRVRDRAADIQVFKNSRLVGEGIDGLLVILEETPGDYGDYIRTTVEAENADRMVTMKKTAETEKRSLVDVQKQQAELWRNRSFKGEWIEAPQATGKPKWIQKEG